MATRRVIPINAAPPAPRCFSARDIWISYLTTAQEVDKDSARPFGPDGQYRPDFAFCRDCASKHAAVMTLEGRCDYHGYVAGLKAQEEATCSSK
jgi:hypothetical protein